MQKWVIAFLIQDPCDTVQISHFIATTIASTCLKDGIKNSSSIYLYVPHFTNALSDPNISNLNNFVHNTLFHSSSAQCLCSFAHLNLFFLLARFRFCFFFATLPRRPTPWSRLFTAALKLLFYCTISWSYQLKGLWGVCFLKLEANVLMNLSSCEVVHHGLPLLSILVGASLCCEGNGAHI